MEGLLFGGCRRGCRFFLNHWDWYTCGHDYFASHERVSNPGIIDPDGEARFNDAHGDRCTLFIHIGGGLSIGVAEGLFRRLCSDKELIWAELTDATQRTGYAFDYRCGNNAGRSDHDLGGDEGVSDFGVIHGDWKARFDQGCCYRAASFIHIVSGSIGDVTNGLITWTRCDENGLRSEFADGAIRGRGDAGNLDTLSDRWISREQRTDKNGRMEGL